MASGNSGSGLHGDAGLDAADQASAEGVAIEDRSSPATERRPLSPSWSYFCGAGRRCRLSRAHWLVPGYTSSAFLSVGSAADVPQRRCGDPCGGVRAVDRRPESQSEEDAQERVVIRDAAGRGSDPGGNDRRSQFPHRRSLNLQGRRQRCSSRQDGASDRRRAGDSQRLASLQGRKRGASISQGLAVVATFICILNLLGHLYGAGDKFIFGVQVAAANNTLIAILLLGGGILLVQADRGLMAVITSGGPGGTAARLLLPAAILVPAVLGWIRWKAESSYGLFGTSVGLTLFAASNFSCLLC